MLDITTLIVLALSITTILGLMGMGVNAVRLLNGFKNGILAKGWKYISIAAFFLIYGIIALDLSISSWLPNDNLDGFLGFSGAVCQAVGALAFAYGCKSQHDAWNPKGMKKGKDVPEIIARN